jgi:hypothetical protein
MGCGRWAGGLIPAPSGSATETLKDRPAVARSVEEAGRFCLAARGPGFRVVYSGSSTKQVTREDNLVGSSIMTAARDIMTGGARGVDSSESVYPAAATMAERQVRRIDGHDPETGLVRAAISE